MNLYLLLFGSALFFATVLAAPDSRARHHSTRFSSLNSSSVHSSLSTDVEVNGNEFASTLNDDWAGGVLPPISGAAILEVETQFTIPDYSAPIAEDGYWSVTMWAGIDGRLIKTALLQAGVELEVKTVGGVVDTRATAFYEWFPDPATFVLDLEINKGDEIYVIVKALTPSTGEITLENITTGTKRVIDVEAPPGSALRGLNAEWIVESFINSNGARAPLPNFGTITFSACQAIADGQRLTVQDADLFDLQGTTTGNILTESSILDDHTIQVKYLASE